MERKYNQKQHNKVRRFVRLSLFLAIIILQTWVPLLGYINIPPISVTIIHITVIVATLWLGRVDGMMVGTFWGVNSMIRALVQGTLTRDVFGSPLVSVLPRILMPFVLSAVIVILRRQKVNDTVTSVVAGIVGTVLNTTFVLGAIVLFKQANFISALNLSDTAAFWNVLYGIIATNGVAETVAAALITPALYLALSKKFGRYSN